ncbi:hypothetical protein [Sporosarcina cyprini]|uniref:hypothetical protein n=1 Tax=Sporosarcina cyprini TaxID=2910523 RepID=UPI001EDE9A4C|nr:hypothetical protein [Sporosarcina cyprini]MCG3089821.1 hypothetical protein [Sporosarcina cyprini]
MVERLTTSIVLYGEIDSSNSDKWLYFYNYVLNFIKSINLSPNYMAVSNESIKSSKISPIKRVEKNLLSAIENKEEISSLSIYSLPDKFETAAFDYNAYICRTNRLKYSHIIITLPIEIYKKIDYKQLIAGLENFIELQSGEIFNMSNLESPQLYASKANAPSTFKTLDVTANF